ncbi:hypothetical protein [Pseudophaeobacter sp.]|uniref:hypothetical protein n=1 Tax=Pseudophaeobacter sp. TaxID=1971739 RepID=UPI003299E812
MRLCLFAAAWLLFSHPALAQDQVVDGSSTETYERSVKSMVEGMSDEDREAFGRGLMNLIITGYPAAQGAEGLAMLQFMEPAVEAAHITLDGMSREEILSRGREIVAADNSSHQQPQGADPTEDLRTCLQASVLVTNPSIEKGSYGRTISMDVTNNLTWAIAGIRVEYIAMSEGRSVPWERDNFSLSISGGIEPGETRTIRTSASLFPSDAPEELITTASVLDVSDPLERQLIKDVTVIGWAEEQSSMNCD